MQTEPSSRSCLSSGVPLSCAERGYSSTAASNSEQFKRQGCEPPSPWEESERQRRSGVMPPCVLETKRNTMKNPAPEGLEINLVKEDFSSAQLNRPLSYLT